MQAQVQGELNAIEARQTEKGRSKETAALAATEAEAETRRRLLRAREEIDDALRSRRNLLRELEAFKEEARAEEERQHAERDALSAKVQDLVVEQQKVRHNGAQEADVREEKCASLERRALEAEAEAQRLEGDERAARNLEEEE